MAYLMFLEKTGCFLRQIIMSSFMIKTGVKIIVPNGPRKGIISMFQNGKGYAFEYGKGGLDLVC